MVKLKIKRKEGCGDIPLPVYMTAGSSGMDVCAACEGSVTLSPSETRLIPAGFFMEIPEGYEAQIRPRSGLALKHGLTVLNSPGTIDSDYRGEVGIILSNLGRAPYTVNRGDRIAQMVIAKVERAEILLEEPSETARSSGGFGHTGI